MNTKQNKNMNGIKQLVLDPKPIDVSDHRINPILHLNRHKVESGSSLLCFGPIIWMNERGGGGLLICCLLWLAFSKIPEGVRIPNPIEILWLPQAPLKNSAFINYLEFLF